MLNSRSYEYNFEIETILQQFIAIIDNAIVMRYSKNSETGERELEEVIKPGYILGTKQRVMLDIINKAKNYELPVVIITLSGISFVKERQTGNNRDFNIQTKNVISSYARPTPISIKVEVTIMTKYMTDLYQIYGKLATQFQPALAFSWFVPQISSTNWVELRNKIEWDGELSLDVRTEAKNSDEDKFTGKMNFTIDGWLFPTMNECSKNIIYDIGTTVVPSEETLSRIYDEIGAFRPLVYSVLKGEDWKKYNNPREFATAHPTITSLYYSSSQGSKEFNLIIDKFRAEKYKLSKNTLLTINGYNFKDAKVLLIPQRLRDSVKGVEYYVKEYTEQLHPFPNSLQEKESVVKGYLLNIRKQTENQIVVDFKEPLSISGNFDIAVLNEVDYDLLSKRKGFILKS